jgi:hypothetical protein
MNLKGVGVVALATGLLLSAGSGVGRAQGGISTEGPLTVFRTGTNESLVTLSLPFSAPATNSPSFLRFDFGFATAEPDAPDTFFDSFSVTLQRNDQSATALLLTADRTGVQWAPPASGALSLNASEIQRAETNFPSLTPDLAIKFAFSVSFLLPSVLTGGPLQLFLDLFDNLNPSASLAFVRDVRIQSAIPRAVRLLSTTPVTGTFSEEAGAVLNEANRTITLPRPTGNRFFRIAGEQTTRIVGVRVVGNQLMVEYQFVQLTLQSADTANGLYSEETAAVLNETTRSLTLTKPAGSRFYRLVSDVPSRMKPPHLAGEQLILDYEFNP